MMRRGRPPLLTSPGREKDKSAKIVCTKIHDVGRIGTGENQGLCQNEREDGWTLHWP